MASSVSTALPPSREILLTSNGALSLVARLLLRHEGHPAASSRVLLLVAQALLPVRCC